MSFYTLRFIYGAVGINLKMDIKPLKYFIIIFLSFFSCEQAETKKNVKVLSEENRRLKDSIAKILSTNERAFQKDSVVIDYSKGPLGRLYYSDTLVLSVRFADCGEFGGHKEYLKIYSNKEKFLCLFINKMVDCEKSYSDYIKIDSTLFELTEKNQRSVIKYLSELTEIGMLEQGLSNNYSNDYEMVLNTAHSGAPFFIENPMMSLYFQDDSLEWSAYIKLREEIKTNANNTYSK